MDVEQVGVGQRRPDGGDTGRDTGGDEFGLLGVECRDHVGGQLTADSGDEDGDLVGDRGV